MSSFLIGSLMVLPGCLDILNREVNIGQPLQFNHAKHIQYFLDGNHKGENIKLHLEDLSVAEAPTELLEGNCLECHDTLEDKPNCRGCHLIFQDENTKKNRAQRLCLGCHRGAWTAYEASIPTIQVCKSCHSEKPRTKGKQERKLREYIMRSDDIPWVQINTLIEDVQFSHVAHVRFAGISCTYCHPQDMRKQSNPPDRVLVFSMGGCIGCHEQRQASSDCLACHK